MKNESKNNLTFIEKLLKLESKTRPLTTQILPNSFVTFIYSNLRKFIISALANTKFDKISLPERAKITLWDIDFNCGLFNAAGMFKNGEGYYNCAKMGAGAYIAGTTTLIPRKGNRRNLIPNPFIPYPFSNSASNWMGLPNKGHEFVANELSKIEKVRNCPLGVSIAGSPEIKDEMNKVKGVVEGLKIYEKAGVDFIEINNSCPNVPQADKLADYTPMGLVCNRLETQMVQKLTYISENFLQKRTRNIPVIVKYSNDFDTEMLTQIVDLLIELGFDGINLGNTSTDYKRYLQFINTKDKDSFSYFTNTFGGGLSGAVLKDRSLFVCKYVNSHINSRKLAKEFYCIRTGGISSRQDIYNSQEAGVLLNEWYTGFFENFAEYGFRTYQQIFQYGL